MTRCTGPCERDLPDEAFSPSARDADGNVTKRQRRCRECRRAAAKAIRRNPPPRPDGYVVPSEKMCAGCRRVKETRDFSVDQRWADGSVRHFKSVCRKCDTARVTARQAADPERRRRADRRRRAENAASAERERERGREWARVKYREQVAAIEDRVTRFIEVIESRGATVDRLVSRGRTYRLTIREPGKPVRVVRLAARDRKPDALATVLRGS